MSASQRFRPDIEGLRAIAITSVVLYHAGIRSVSGGFVGVDIFFVLSGFLISGLLLREIETTGRVHLREFWARRVRRLLPAATLVLLITVAVATIALPPTVRTDTANAVTSATLYSANWFFAANSLDYLAAEDAPSPVLHFWSLGVEEQFYLVWPILLIALAAIARRRHTSLRRVFAGAAATIWVTSFAACVYLSTAAQPIAFFGSPTRFWQLATGALLAIATPRLLATPLLVRLLAQALGMIVLIASIFMMGGLIDRGLPYPGWIALIPTLATATVVAGGMRARHDGTSAIDRLLALPGIQWLGGLSYSWYLWHWPVLVLWEAAVGDADRPTTLALIVVALLLAWGSHELVENPVRFARGLRDRAGASLALGGFLMAWTVLAASAMSMTDARHADVTAVTFHPLPAEAREDLSRVYADNCTVAYHDIVQPECLYASTTSTRRIVLIGDSHAAAIFPAVEAAAVQLGYALDVRIKLGCTTADVVQWHYKFDKPFPECSAWRRAQMADLTATPADVVIMVNADNPPPQVFDKVTGMKLSTEAGHAAWIDGYERTLRTLQATGSTIIALRDNPRVPGIIADCVSRHMDTPASCDFPRTFGLPEPAADMEAAARVPGVATMDLSSRICDWTTCFAVRDNILAWQKGNHYTATFARSLAGDVATRITAILAAPTPSPSS